ncbi:MAG: hypothetical protein LC109_01010 [Bacteroidia bacterium]|nr:hypothetical protein [Bacteroidia bacterium]MCO5253215.1 hypothetical protein [Bacteroidota bacterium]MCZ2128826.1 hypothetical protein [Bacteroidia bacterium]
MKIENKLKDLLKGWNLMRILYLVMGVMMVVQAVQIHDWFVAIMGIALFSMGVFKMGCAGTKSCCNTSNTQTPQDKKETITFEEIK